MTTGPGARVPDWDWARVAPRLPVNRVRQLMDALFGLGHSGMRLTRSRPA